MLSKGERQAEDIIRIGIVAGEASGDILGAGVIKSLRQAYGNIVVEGIGGPLMIAEGCQSFFVQDRLAVMGLIEPLKRLPQNIERHNVSQQTRRVEHLPKKLTFVPQTV